ncbi:uncharacterized protein METZ01_LOCUS310004, partial [marine metagenome]
VVHWSYPVNIDVRTEETTVDGPREDGRVVDPTNELSTSPSVVGVPDIERFVIGTDPDTGTVLRLSPWRGDVLTVQVVVIAGPTPQFHDVDRLLDYLDTRGVLTVVTTALSPIDQRPFVEAGFTPHEHLLLLGRAIEPNDLPARGRRTRPARRQDQDAVLALDERAFATSSAVWRFDGAALAEAGQATQTCRRRLIKGPRRQPIGHAVTGRTSTIGFLQRLAVDPSAEGQGIGSALVVDALRWLGRTGALEAWVNTQPRNLR